ncbi:lysophospholipase [Carboxylicivirga sp. RSCT41]|uniref:alpha/beta hydrolase n=1 Tax=Carboxylicivirga agarovorans TaxID=3417570 RepID=UPI003D32DEFE
MIRETFTISSVSGKKLFGQTWRTPATPKAVVVLVHGFGEHCSRYTTYIKLFEHENIAFISMDQIGHGQSEGKRGLIQSYQQLLDDVDKLIDKAESLYQGIPKFLYGHSMGGNIAFNYLLQRNYPFKGAIISSPWLRLSNELSAVSRLFVRLFSYLIPNVTTKSRMDSNHISSNRHEVQAYNIDELNHGRISFRLLNNIMKQGRWAMANSKLLKVPTLLLHGSKDQITSHLASRDVAAKTPESIQYIEFDGMYHEVHNDAQRELLAGKCIEWIKKRIEN